MVPKIIRSFFFLLNLKGKSSSDDSLSVRKWKEKLNRPSQLPSIDESTADLPISYLLQIVCLFLLDVLDPLAFTFSFPGRLSHIIWFGEASFSITDLESSSKITRMKPKSIASWIECPAVMTCAANVIGILEASLCVLPFQALDCF
ncbi:hypothetical protein F3Y22_tig00112649pilonHSYRG00004 [Hibiscus syriacus]|uniref:Uncharacterized protein n=1 Tax=Hibiscus syriacus TaxID=106335 RepID=A0A6A2Y4G1_HIBSY|nr:hypothetical protein F3Y22_tig00112649pilonHSYRG00004 [Hibiscus syriacus]